MTEHSPRMSWGYPSEDADPWLEDFLAFVRGTDASAYAAREDRNMLLMGGGLISWDAASGALTWAAEIELLSPNTGFLNRIPAGSVTIADGQVVFGSVARALGMNASLAVSTGSFAPSTDNAIVLCIRRGASIYWRTGLIMGDGDTITNIGSSQSGSGTVVLAGDASGSASATVVEALRGFPIDPAFSPSVNHGIRWDGSKFVSFLLPTSVAGDVTGAFGSTTVARLRGGLIDPTISPNVGDIIQFDGMQYVAAPLPASGAASNFIVFRPGGVTAGIVHDSWASFYAAGLAIDGPVYAYIDDRFASAQVPSGSYNFNKWKFFGAIPGRRTTLTFLDGANWTISGSPPSASFSVTDMALEVEFASTTSAISSPLVSSGQLLIELHNATIAGGTEPFPFVNATANNGGAQFTVTVHAYGPSELRDYAFRVDADAPGSGSTVDIHLYDTALVQASAVNGPSGTVTQRQWNRAATIRAQAGVVSGQAYYFGQATPQNWSLDKTQLGTTELHIGSVWIPATAILRSISRAMLGGSLVGEVGQLNLRRFTGGTLVASWTAPAGTIQDVLLDGSADVVIADSDWYDLYLVAGDVSHTAVIKGLRLFVHEPGNVS